MIADKAYDTEDFIETTRELSPHTLRRTRMDAAATWTEADRTDPASEVYIVD